MVAASLSCMAISSPTLAASPLREKSRSKDDVLSSIERDLYARKKINFESLLKDWEKRYGTRAVPALVAIASDKTAQDTNRYIAIMGSARLGGGEILKNVSPLLQDDSWMVRTAVLRVMNAMGDARLAETAIPLLKDKALVVRSEAIEVVEKHRPTGFEDALLSLLEDPTNYHKGVAQWVPERALLALAKLPPSPARGKRLESLLEDPELIQDKRFKTLVNRAIGIQKNGHRPSDD